MKKPVIIIAFIFTIIIGLSLVQINLSNQISTAGTELAKLEQQVAEYKRQNIVLKEQVLEASSLTNISKKAETLGFAPTKSQVYLNTPLPLALR
jgi:cell division protein FtsL